MLKFLLFTFLSWSLLSANTDTRTWRLTDGQEILAELVSYDEESDQVELLIDDTEKSLIPFADFKEIDKAWIIEWSEVGHELRTLSNLLDGSLEHFVAEGDFQTDLFAYFPSSYGMDTPKDSFPLMILFNAGGKAQRYLLRHIEAAEEANMVVIACGQFRNTKNDPGKEEGFAKRFKEVFPAIQDHFTYDPDMVYMGGNSGGAWRAYNFTVDVNYRWAGIYANGGWLGGTPFKDRDYADEMKVAMVNGNNDKAANNWVEHDSAVLQKHGAKISLISFEGGHQVPPKETQVKAFKWLIDSEQFKER